MDKLAEIENSTISEFSDGKRIFYLRVYRLQQSLSVLDWMKALYLGVSLIPDVRRITHTSNDDKFKCIFQFGKVIVVSGLAIGWVFEFQAALYICEGFARGTFIIFYHRRCSRYIFVG